MIIHFLINPAKFFFLWQLACCTKELESRKIIIEDCSSRNHSRDKKIVHLFLRSFRIKLSYSYLFLQNMLRIRGFIFFLKGYIFRTQKGHKKYRFMTKGHNFSTFLKKKWYLFFWKKVAIETYQSLAESHIYIWLRTYENSV